MISKLFKISICALFILRILSPTMGQDNSDALILTLEQAKNYAIENNKSLKNSKTDVEISDKQIWAAISQGLPQVEASIDYTDYFNYEAEFAFGGGGIPEEQLQLIDQLMAAGSLQDQTLWQISRATVAPSEPTAIKMDNSSSAKLQVSQLIFSGQYFSGIQIAKIAKELANMNYENSELTIKESVISAYYLILVTEESLKIIDANLENLNKTMKQTETMVSAGVAEPLDLDQLLITVNMLENSRSQVRRSVELNYNLLRFLLGVSFDTDITLTDNLETLIEEINFDLLLNSNLNYDDNITYQMLSLQENMSEKMLNLEKWNYAPSIVGFYSYNEKILTTDFDMNPNHIAGISMTIPIFSSGMRRANVQQKQLELLKVQTNKQILEEQLTMQEKQYRYDLISAIEQYELQKQNVDVARRVYDKIDMKYNQGVSSSLDLTQANSNLLDAENNYISSLMNLLQAKLNYNKLLNNL
ncbi:MAG TPA: TolC family protein [Bacteroidales bacterium]|nr:TolC family protein [Bacteroidales bacterium]HXK81642.1 TolC family protein [Bacteroidales bacterium]